MAIFGRCRALRAIESDDEIETRTEHDTKVTHQAACPETPSINGELIADEPKQLAARAGKELRASEGDPGSGRSDEEICRCRRPGRRSDHRQLSALRVVSRACGRCERRQANAQQAEIGRAHV